METSDSPKCRTSGALQTKVDRKDIQDGKRKMSDYFKSSTNRVADKRVSELLTLNS